MRYASAHGTDSGVVQAWVNNSHYRRDWVLRLLHEQLLAYVENPKITVWGLAYKQDTHSTKNSPALALIDHLDAFDIAVYDPVVPATAVAHRELEQMQSALDACQGADILIIMTPWKKFKDVAPEDIRTRMAGSIVVDPYGVLDTNACTARALQHFTLGRTNA